jgi:hypothetical protein
MNNNNNKLKIIITAVLLCCAVATFNTATAKMNCQQSAEAINKLIGDLDSDLTHCISKYYPTTIGYQCGSCYMSKLFHIELDQVHRVKNSKNPTEITNNCVATNANGIKFKFKNTGELSTLSCKS